MAIGRVRMISDEIFSAIFHRSNTIVFRVPTLDIGNMTVIGTVPWVLIWAP